MFPAAVLLILSSLTVLFCIASIPSNIAHIRAIDTSTARGSGERFGYTATMIAWPLMNVAVAVGATSMIRLKSHRMSHTAALLSLIPLCSPCFVLGIPFGLWAIVVLGRPEVRQRFMEK